MTQGIDFCQRVLARVVDSEIWKELRFLSTKIGVLLEPALIQKFAFQIDMSFATTKRTESEAAVKARYSTLSGSQFAELDEERQAVAFPRRRIGQ